MKASANRLRKTTDIQKVYNSGQKVYHPLVRSIILPTTHSASRFTIIVSQRVSKKAVERNRVKRRLRTIVMNQLMPILRTSYDMIFIVQPAAIDAEYAVLEKAIQKLSLKQQKHGV